ncbi:HlyD family efflux transporter periplasmic adaptor subunit [Legionella gresilensis]|uniref:HlyD family efflux transporter periplasmic adaptor subunit n=1 Tax=Legionella gresilensis TaxID=91823 RepID=UPI001041A6E5|nr:HlyD family efflux transporter periplasmic adaptor subunit [Legionella gresilensis]
MKKELFRQEVFNQKKISHLGVISINTPLSFKFFTYSSVVILLIIILFIIFGEFSDKFLVIGYLNDSKGVVSLYPSKNGVIIKNYKKQGELVKRGEAILLINSLVDNQLLNRNNILENLIKRKQSINNDISNKSIQLKKLKMLLTKKYISLDLYNAKKQELVELNRILNTVELDIIKYKQEQFYSIYSPIDGVIAADIFKEGQYVNLAKPLVKILPIKSELIANLFIPTNQIGFINKASKITIRYDAFPYKRFGSYSAVIDTIDETILTDNEDEKPIQIGYPYYKVHARLKSQYVMVYGQPKRLQQGLTITAIINGPKRKIWQWVLDPIFSMYGELKL